MWNLPSGFLTGTFPGLDADWILGLPGKAGFPTLVVWNVLTFGAPPPNLGRVPQSTEEAWDGIFANLPP